MEKQPPHPTLDLFEMRRQITTLRAKHSNNPRVTYLLNGLLTKFAFLNEPEGADRAARLL